MNKRGRLARVLARAERRLSKREREVLADKVSQWIRTNGEPGDADAYARRLVVVLRANAGREMLDDDEQSMALAAQERRLAAELEALGLGEYSDADEMRLTILTAKMPARLRGHLVPALIAESPGTVPGG